MSVRSKSGRTYSSYKEKSKSEKASRKAYAIKQSSKKKKK